VVDAANGARTLRGRPRRLENRRLQTTTELTVSCPGTSETCTIQADMWVENGDATTAGNSNAICLYVDGKPAVTCGDSGETFSDRSFTQNSSSQSVSGLTHGNHTIQTYFFSVNGAYLGYYASNYRVYKP
jgi:hypothetical protein